MEEAIYPITTFRNMYASEEGTSHILGGISGIYEALKITEDKNIIWKDKVSAENKKIYNPYFPLWSPNIYTDNHRTKNNALSMCCFVFDIDYGSPTLETLEAAIPFQMIIHRSFNWKPNNMRWRVIVPINEIVIFSDDKAVREDHMRHMFEWWHGFFKSAGIMLDVACKDMARQFFMPVTNAMTQYGPDLTLYATDREVFDIGTIPAYSPPQPVKQKPRHNPSPLNGTKTFYRDFENNNFFDERLRKMIRDYSSLPDGSHYSAFFNLITAVRRRHVRAFKTEIDSVLLEEVMADIDMTCGGFSYQVTSGYGLPYISKKIMENYNQKPLL